MDEIFICSNCIAESRLKKLVVQQGGKGRCQGCEEDNIVMDINTNEFDQMVKALIRYYYSEWEYNDHLGGEQFFDFLENEFDRFFVRDRIKDTIVVEELIASLDATEVYEDEDKGVSLFAGYWEGEMNMPLRAIKSTFHHGIRDIEHRLNTENYFNLEAELHDHVAYYKDGCTLTFEKDSIFYRARSGYTEKRFSVLGGGWEGEEIYLPHLGKNIGAPPIQQAEKGRLNRQGVSYLYCATDSYTSVAEIRPHPGEIISLAQFALQRDVKLYDLSDSQFLNYYLTDEKLKDYIRLNTLSEMIQRVIPPNSRSQYSITQLIADCVRNCGFDGIYFNSSVGKGYNLVLFDPKLAACMDTGNDVIRIDAVDYQYSGLPWANKFDPDFEGHP